MKYLTFLTLLFLPLLAKSQPRKVIFVSGAIRKTGADRPVKRGDILNGTEILHCSNAEDSLIVAVLGKGIAVLKPARADNNNNNNKRAEWLMYLTNEVWFTGKNAALRGRPGPVNTEDALAVHLHTLAARRALLVIDSLNINITGELAGEAKNGFFFFKYESEDGPVNKRLKVLGSEENMRLHIDTGVYYTDGKKLLREFHAPVTLCRYDPEKGGSYEITSFDLYLKSAYSVLPDLCLLRSGNPSYKADAVAYIECRFGNGDTEQIEATLGEIKCP